MNIKFLIATHKMYWFPSQKYYMPLHVGSKEKDDLGIMRDDTGINISNKNDNFCELTGMYWAWKNLQCDVIGICHYRRYFDFKRENKFIRQRNICISNKAYIESCIEIDEARINQILNKYDMILPKHQYFINGLKHQYLKIHKQDDLDKTIEIVTQIYPEYKNTLDQFCSMHNVYLYNMIICTKTIYDSYMEWLMPILFELEHNIQVSEDSYQKRVIGFISERLLNWYLLQNDLKVKELPIIMIEDKAVYKEILIQENWITEILRQIKYKLINKEY